MDSTEVKQESVDLAESNPDNVEVSSEAHTYILQQQQLPYSNSSREVIPSESNNETEEPASKRPRRASAMRALEHMDSEDDDLDDGDDFAKAESDASDKEEDEEEESFQGPSTSLDDQPGPSGMGKGSSEASCMYENPLEMIAIHTEIDIPDEKMGTFSPAEEATYKSHKCPKCFPNSEDRSKLMNHLISHRNGKPYECELCGIHFRREGPRIIYLKKKKELFQCKFCLKHLTRRSYLEAHTKTHYTKVCVGRCDICDKDFFTENAYQYHMKNKHSSIEYVCDICSRPCSSQRALRTHRRRHEEGYLTNEQYPCNLCGKKFIQKRHLMLHHRRVHEKDKFYVCEYCGQQLSRLESLKHHLLIHQGLRPIECSTCKKTFTTKSTLMIHLRVHTGEKPYRCKECGKSFTQRSSYTTHLRFHTGERPYKCKFCDRDFVCKSAMSTHVKNKH